MSDAGLPISTAVLRAMHTGGAEQPIDAAFYIAKAARSAVRGTVHRRRKRDVMDFARRAHRLMRRSTSWTDAQILARLHELSDRLDLGAPRGEVMARTLALVAAMAARKLGLTPFVTQLAGAGVLLSGGVAEMETGSGKTLTSALASVCAVLAGERVHLITANDYLAERDHEWLSPFYAVFGLTSGVITHQTQQADRPDVYRSHIVHGSNKEVAFDYLRNRISLGGEAGPIRLALEQLHKDTPRCRAVTMQGLPFAIVDEADSVLVDECRTPLIISATQDPDPEWAETALHLTEDLNPGKDFELDRESRRVTLTQSGRRKLVEAGEALGGVWRNTNRRNHAASQALVAKNLFLRDEHYVVREDKVELIDEYTGRVATDRSLGDGLQQVIECKEGVTVTGRRFTLGRITYQRFFRNYRRLAGMTGTAREIAGELSAVYGLEVTSIRSPHRSRRRFWRPRIYRTEAKKLAAVVSQIKTLQRKGRPVLVATRTLKASVALSAILEDAGIEHAVLNATQDKEESEIIAQAGKAGRVTVATNMAGRGVDIKIDDDVRRLGGLHVILTEFHEAGRIDRQVFGRAARQGDPGSVQEMLSWSDPLIETFAGWRGRWRRGYLATFLKAQRRAEALHARARLDLLKQDQRRNEQLNFTGTVE